MMFTVNDFFCGCGGMTQGFVNSGFRIIGAWDWDKQAVTSYQANFGNHVKQMDIKDLSHDNVEDAHVWAFGFPCQDLSNCGRLQRGLIDGERSRMFFEIMRLLDELDRNGRKTPKFIMAENVNDVKPYLPIIEDEYAKRGYDMVYGLYNSQFWGVPQNRERYYIVGVKKTEDITFNMPKQNTECSITLDKILESEANEKYYLSKDKIARLIEQVKLGKESRSRGIICINPRKVDGSQTYQQDRIYRTEGVMVAVTAQLSGRLNIVEHNGRYRKLTPREFARLQGFPDTYKIIVSDGQAYKQFGNAVTVNVVKRISDEMLNSLKFKE